MSYNDGAPKNPLKIQDKHQAAIDFSEGNKHLENLLNYCFNHNLLTIGCCPGHEYNYNTTNQYITFCTCQENEQVIRHIIDALYQKGYRIEYICRNPAYPTMSVSTDDLSKNMFDDILEAIKTYEQQPITELSATISRIMANTIDKYDTTIKIEKKSEGVSVTCYIEYDYEEKIIPENEVVDFLNKRIDSFYFDISKEKSFPPFAEIHTKERMWQEFSKVLRENNIEFTDPSEIDLTEWVGAYGKDSTIKKEIVVRDGDTIETVAKKLEVLKDQMVNAKAVINGVELTNIDYQESTNAKSGRTTYINTFTKERCVEQYYRLLIDVVNKNLYSGELQVANKDPLRLTFSNQYLSDEEITKRLIDLKNIGINAWFTYPYIMIKTTEVTDLEKTLNGIQKSKKWQVKYEIIQILSLTEDETLIEKLLDIYSKINIDNLEELFLNYQEILHNNGINLQDTANKYNEACQEFDKIHEYLAYDTYVLYMALKRVLSLQKKSAVISELLQELDSLALASKNAKDVVEHLIKNYYKDKDNKQEFNPDEFCEKHRL